MSEMSFCRKIKHIMHAYPIFLGLDSPFIESFRWVFNSDKYDGSDKTVIKRHFLSFKKFFDAEARAKLQKVLEVGGR